MKKQFKEFWQDFKVLRKAGVEVRGAPLRLGIFAMGFIASISLADSNSLHLRGELPEPFDYFSHATNFSGSLANTALWGTLLARTYVAEAKEPTAAKTRAVAGAAVGALLLANTLFETKLGVRLIDQVGATTPDATDLVWGTAGTMLGAASLQIRHVAQAESVPAEDLIHRGIVVVSRPADESLEQVHFNPDTSI